MSTEDGKSRVTRRKFLAWSAAAAASAGIAPLLSACSQPAASTPAAQPTAAKAVAPTQPPAKSGVIELKLDHHEPAQGNLGRTFQAYADAVNKTSEGRLHITVYPAQTLSKAADAYTNCINGVNDIAWTAISYYPGQFKLNEAFMLPMLGITSGKHGARAQMEWLKTNTEIQKEWSQVHILAFFCNGVQYLHTAKKAVRKLEDAAGLKIRVSGYGGTNYIKNLQADPVPTSVPECYEALSKGILDGGVLDWQAVDSQHLNELLKYSNTLPLYNTPQTMAFNQKKWDSIPPDLQKILESPPGLTWQSWDPDRQGPVPSLAEFLANGFDVADGPGIANFKKSGGEIITFPADEAARWEKAAEPVWNAWCDTVKGESWDAQKELQALRDIIAKTK